MKAIARATAGFCVASLIACLAACGSTPRTIVKPAINPAATAASGVRDRYLVNEKPLSDPSQVVLLPVERTFDGATTQIEAYHDAWAQQADVLSANQDALGNTQFAGAVIGAIGAMASTIDVTRTGTVVAGGAGVWDSRYQLAVQSENYTLAADAMYCIYQEVTRLPRGFWTATYYESGSSTGSMKHDMDYYRTDDQSEEELLNGYNTLDGLFDTIAGAVRDVVKRLTKAQRSLHLGTPSAGDIQASLTDAAKNEPAAEKAAEALKRGVTANFRTAGQPPVVPQPMRTPAGVLMAVPAADLAKYQAAVVRHQNLFAQLSAAELAAKLKDMQKSADISKADYKKALQLPSKLETCTKKIGG